MGIRIVLFVKRNLKWRWKPERCHVSICTIQSVLCLGWNSTTHAQSADLNYQFRDQLHRPVVRGQRVVEGVIVAVVEQGAGICYLTCGLFVRPDQIDHVEFDGVMKGHQGLTCLFSCSFLRVLPFWFSSYYQWIKVIISIMMHKITVDITMITIYIAVGVADWQVALFLLKISS